METGRAARVDDWTTLPAPDAEAVIAEGFRSVVGAPINVDGTLWGVIVVLADEILRGVTHDVARRIDAEQQALWDASFGARGEGPRLRRSKRYQDGDQGR